jgi:alkylation response protein AidB-like acyl-CoA dehydrogenase
VDFTPSDTQREIAGLASRALPAADPWKELAHAGLLALALPDWLDGDGLGAAETGTLLAEVGRRGASVPALATLALGVLPVVRWGSRDLQEDVLAGIGTGDRVLTAALHEPSDPFPAQPTTLLRDGTVTGVKVGVPYCAEASHVLVPVIEDGVDGGRAEVAVVDPGSCDVQGTYSSCGQPEYTLRLDQAPVLGLLGGGALDGLYQSALAGACCVADGAVAGALELTREHVRTREQFGRPIATFQAAAQHVADVYIAARTLHLAATSATWRLAERLDASADLDVAAYWLATRAPAALRTCHHLHGGTGMDATYPLPRLSALVKDLVRFTGGAEYRLSRLAGRQAAPHPTPPSAPAALAPTPGAPPLSPRPPAPRRPHPAA